MTDDSPGPSRQWQGSPQQWLRRSRRRGSGGTMATEEDVLGFRVTLNPEHRAENHYLIKFTPIASGELKQDTSTDVEIPQIDSREINDPKDSESRNTNDFGSSSGSGVPRLSEDPSLINLRGWILDALLKLLPQESHEIREVSRGSRRIRTTRGARRRRRRRRRRAQRTSGSSEPSMYEVVDVNYENITELSSQPELDWRLVPRYELKEKEVTQQEKELYFLLTSETKAEVTTAAAEGEPTCCICHESLATRVVVPCGHRCLCRPCSLQIVMSRASLEGMRLAKRCPICQAAIGTITRIR